MKRPLVVSLVALLLITGCRHASTPAAPAVDPATAGAITGTVYVHGKVPAPVTIDMSADPACTLSDAKNETEQIVAHDGKLANVYVYIKAGLPDATAPASAPPVVLDQKGCRYAPHVIALQQGGKVEFRNSDPTMHNIHTMAASGNPQNARGNPEIDVSEPPMGQPHTETFATPQTMLAVRCNNHPWMSAFINVAPNAAFAVTGTDGTFTIRNLPPGDYTLAFVHETQGEHDVPVKVAAKSTTDVDFAISPK